MIQHKIAIVGYSPFSTLAREVLVDLPTWIDYEVTELPLDFLGSLDSIHDLQSFFDPSTVVVSGDRSAVLLDEMLTNLVIPVRINSFDFLEIIKSFKTEDVVVVNYGNPIPGLTEISSLLNVRVKQIQFNDIPEAYNILLHLRNSGIMNVIGGSWVCHTAKELGMNGIFYYSHKSIANAIEDALNIIKAYRKELETVTLLKSMISINRNGIISIDTDSNINIINNVTEQLLGIKSNQATGKKLEEVIPAFVKEAPVSSWKEPHYNVIFEHNQKKLMADIVPVILQDENMGNLISIDDVIQLQEKEQKIRKNINQKPMVATYSFNDIISSSKVMKETINEAKKFSWANSSVLIHGESGTGKELFAQSIHLSSQRNRQPFVAVNCAALPENLIDSELFGYEEGSFTGAKKGGKIGLFELAHKGTIFLDEISELPLHLQSRLLRVLQEKEVVRVGGNQIIPIDVRIIAASNKNLLNCIEDGTFREDLYFRISVLQLSVPPLRQRHGDIQKLFLHFIKDEPSLLEIIDDNDLEILLSYHWPGNVRELENVAERFIVLCQNETLTKQKVHNKLHKSLYPMSTTSSKKDVKSAMHKQDVEAELIEKALVQTNGNKEKAAELLGISRTTLWRRLKAKV